MPQRICASHLEKEPPHQHNLTKLIVRHPPTACTGPAQRQDRSSSLRCGRSVLTPALTQCCLHGARKPAKPLLNNLLTHPAPSGMTMPVIVGGERRSSLATPPPGLRPAAVALRAAQNRGLPCSSDRRAPDLSRPSADGCALWSRPETRYLPLPSPLRRNIFPPDASALWSIFGRGSALVNRCPLSLPLCFRHHQQIVGSRSSSG